MDFSIELKSAKLPKKPKFFGKTVSESTRQAEEDKVVHVIDKLMYTLLKEVETEGMLLSRQETNHFRNVQAPWLYDQNTTAEEVDR